MCYTHVFPYIHIHTHTGGQRDWIHFVCVVHVQVFDGLLRAGPDVKDALIRWIVECLEQNKDRGKVHVAQCNF